MTAMISLSKLESTPNVNVKVNPKVNVNVGNASSNTQMKSREVNEVEPINVCYGEETETETEDTTLKELRNENEVLKLLIEMLRSNPLIYQGYIVADDVVLMKFIKLLTSADDVQLDAEDLGQGCLTKNTYRKVHAIYVIKNNETFNLKYDYPKVMKELKDLGVSCKFVF